MAENSASLSFRSLSMWIVMAVTSITLILATGLSLYTQVGALKTKTQTQLRTMGQVLAANVANHVADGDNDAAQKRLDSLVFFDNVSNAHIYWIDQSGRKDFFTSYNRRGQSTVENKIGQLTSLYQGRLIGSVLEIAIPIEYEGNRVGDLYLRATFNEADFVISQSIVLHGIIFIVMVLVGFLLTLKLQRLYTIPIESLSELLQHVAQNKDYGLRAQRSTIKEVDMLSNSVNTMLSRFQNVIAKQIEAESQHKKLNANLEQIVNQRTVALKEANHELIQTLEKLHQFQRQIVQNEKMASLGDMVAGVAHEVNTPIGLGVTASTMMLDRLTVIKQQFESKTLKVSAMAKFIDEGEENLNIIYRNLNRAAELISSFKQVAVDQTSEVDRVVNVKQLLNEIILSLRPQIKKTKHTVEVNCDSELTVEMKAGPINQIIINLVVNSLLHAFDKEEQGTVSINITLEDDKTLKVIYTDNGRGIPSSIRKRIFDPFVTTKRGQGGSGLGMHLVYNLVTQALNGSITLLSNEGEGVEFIIMFPVVKL